MEKHFHWFSWSDVASFLASHLKRVENAFTARLTASSAIASVSQAYLCVCVICVYAGVSVCVCVCVVPRPVCLDKRYNRVEMELSTFNCHMQTDTKGRQRPELCEGVWMLARLCFNNENLNHCRQTAYHSSTNKPKLVQGTDLAIL